MNVILFKKENGAMKTVADLKAQGYLAVASC